jgi:LysM repeat protein
MFWRGLYTAGVVLAGLGATGCFNSEADFQALLEENATLSAELAEAHKENEILTRALADIKREQETLQLLLNAGKRGLNAGRANLPQAVLPPGENQVPAATGGDEEEWQTPLDPAAEAPAVEAPAVQAAPVPAAPAARSSSGSSSGRYYITKPGDVLSHIAQANQTTVAKLLELNPSLRNRRNYIIYNNERLRLP